MTEYTKKRLFPTLLLLVALSSSAAWPVTVQAQPAMPDFSGRKILVVLPPRDFVAVQVKCLVVYFRKTGASVDIAGVSLDTVHATERLRPDFGSVTPTVLVNEVDARAYDVVAFCSGPSLLDALSDYRYVDLARHALEAGCLIGAIGPAVAILGNADIVDGRRVTGDAKFGELLERAGARFFEKAVVVDDGPFVTVRPERAGRKFAGRLVKVLARR